MIRYYDDKWMFKDMNNRRRIKMSENITPFTDIAIGGEEEADYLCNKEPNKWCAVSICIPSMADGSKYIFNLENAKKVLKCHFHDISQKREGGILATKEDIKSILEFSEQCHGEALLVHCAAGISRSTASAFLIVLNAIKDKVENPASTAIEIIYSIRPIMYPNKHILEIGIPLVAQSEEETIEWWRDLYNSNTWKKIRG